MLQDIRTYFPEMPLRGSHDAMLRIPPEEVRFLTEEEAKAYGLTMMDPVYEECASDTDKKSVDGASGPSMRKLRVTIAEFHCFFALLISRSFSGKALNSGWGLRRAKHMEWRHTETYLDRRAVYSEAAYLKSVLLWLQGHSGPVGGMPKVSNNYAHEEARIDHTFWSGIVDVPSFLPARNSYE